MSVKKLLQTPIGIFFAVAFIVLAAVALGRLGDVDSNGALDAGDLERLNDYLLGRVMLSEEELVNADVNGDGRIDVADAVSLNRMLAAPTPTPSEPQPTSTPTSTATPIPSPMPSATPTSTPTPSPSPTPSPTPTPMPTPVPMAALIGSSPRDGEGDVAVTRETILSFNEPLNPLTVDSSSIHAQFGGNELGARFHISPDARKVTLFYDSVLPAGARIRVTVDGDLLLDPLGRGVDANRDGQPGGVALIDFDTVTLTTVPGTAVFGRVFASEQAPSGGSEEASINVPLEGVRITVDGREEDFSTTTDQFGAFRLDPAPAGRFFVHIDGRTATADIPEGAYYPLVGKAWDSIPGREVDIGDVSLPLIAPETLHAVSKTVDTVITFPPSVLEQFPEFAGVQMTVPADSLFADGGARGGMVGIAPVPTDRAPCALPPELHFPILITVQTDGATNFDRPVSACFPNLPDPETGELLPPGAKSALWSFNEDTGRFEIVGPMTVSDDGLFVCTDPGVGALSPGWHGTQPGSQISGMLKSPGVCAPQGGNSESVTALSRQRNAVGNAVPAFKRVISRATNVPFGFLSSVANLRSSIQSAVSQSSPDNFAELRKKAETVRDAIGTVIEDEPNRPSAAAQLLEDAKELSGELTSGAVKALEPLIDIIESAEFKDALNAAEALRQFSEASGMAKCPRVQQAGLQASSRADSGLQSLQTAQTQAPRTISSQQRMIEASADIQAVSQQIIDNGDTPALILQLESLGDDLDAEIIEYGASLPEAHEAIDRLEQGASELLGAVEELISVSASAMNATIAIFLDTGLVIRASTSSQGSFMIRLGHPASGEVFAYDPASGFVGRWPLQAPETGTSVNLGSVMLQTSIGSDDDGDGLIFEAEIALGTDPDDSDSDDDGVLDGAEIAQGTDPLGGLPARTGIIASADTPGTAIDVRATNEFAVVADSDHGISVFNVFSAVNPIIIGQIDTPGDAKAVASSGNLIAVADGSAGLAVIDISDPPAAEILHQVSAFQLGGSASAVAAAAGLAFVGLDSGMLAVVDLATGAVLDKLDFGPPIEDVVLSADEIYVLTAASLVPAQFVDGQLTVGDSAGWPTLRGAIGRRFRLAAGADTAYANHTQAYAAFDLSDPLNPVLVPSGDTAQFGWKHLVPNGSGLGVAAVGPSSTNDGPHHVSLFDIGDPAVNDDFIAEFETPGIAAAVSISNGLAYVADGEAGMQVVNYLPHDTMGTSPTLTLTANFSLAPPRVEEGKLARVTANVTDDVQVRNVEFYIDRVRVMTDGAFPFEHRFVTPNLDDQTSFTLRVRASDTGGNFAWSDEILVELTSDSTPPVVTGNSPHDGALISGSTLVAAFFNEPIDPVTLTPSSFSLTETGADDQFDTADDGIVTSGTLEFRPEIRGAFMTFTADLPAGHYRARVEPPLADLAGNPLAETTDWTFRVFDIDGDTDGDCLPDQVELALGLDPMDPDSDDNGLTDGEEDFDGDGLTNCAEILLALDPANPDSDGDGAPDGMEDSDGDGLTDGEEIILGTDPNHHDSDGDGFNDKDEIDNGSDPLDPGEVPLRYSAIAASVRNQAAPGRSEGSVVAIPVSTKNHSAPGLFEGSVVAPPVSVSNGAVP